MEHQLSFLAQPKNSGTATKKISAVPISIFVDGASRGNPGPAGAGIYIAQGDEVFAKVGYYLGKKTNNQAEYLALLIAAWIAIKEIEKRSIINPHLVITSDSELLVRQMMGAYKVKNDALIELKLLIDSLLKTTSHKFIHVLREKNKIADELANKGIDSKKKPPSAFLTFLTTNKMVL